MSRYAACLMWLLLCSSAMASGPVKPPWSVKHLCMAQAASGPCVSTN